MNSILIRNIPDDVKVALREQAAKAGSSLESYLRSVLREKSRPTIQEEPKNLADISLEFFGKDNGEILKIPAREQYHRPLPDFD